MSTSSTSSLSSEISTLEQSQQQTKYLSNMSSIGSASLQLDQLSLASTFIGKTIKYSDGSSSSSSNTLSGVVKGVKLEEDGTVSFIIDGKSVPISNFIEVENTSPVLK